MKQIPALTCCRALFAGWVFAYHVDLQCHYSVLLGPLGAIVRHGTLGVDGFFVLSGMVLAYAHPGLMPTINDTAAFLVKRLVRIYPVHLATIAILAGLTGGALLLGVHPRDPGRFGLNELWRHLLLVHAWGASDRWAWNYPSWSISAEWAGYLMFPALWPVLRGRGTVALAGVLVLAGAGVVIAQAVRADTGVSLTYDGGLLRLFPEFIAGMATVPLVRLLPGAVAAWRMTAAAGTVVVVAGALAGSDSLAIAGLWLALAGLLLGARADRAREDGAGVLARIPGLHWLGEISYSFYMSFALVETAQASLWRVAAIEPDSHRLLYVVSTTALTLALGTTLWASIERPAMRLHQWRVTHGARLRSSGAYS